MSTTALSEAKALAKDYMTLQLRIAEKLVSLTDSEMKEYNNWFRDEPFFTELSTQVNNDNYILNVLNELPEQWIGSDK